MNKTILGKWLMTWLLLGIPIWLLGYIDIKWGTNYRWWVGGIWFCIAVIFAIYYIWS